MRVGMFLFFGAFLAFACLLLGGLAVGFFLHWCVPAIELSTGTLIGVISLSAVVLGGLFVLSFGAAVMSSPGFGKLGQDREDGPSDDDQDENEFDEMSALGDSIASSLLKSAPHLLRPPGSSPGRRAR